MPVSFALSQQQAFAWMYAGDSPIDLLQGSQSSVLPFHYMPLLPSLSISRRVAGELEQNGDADLEGSLQGEMQMAGLAHA
ncbi:hypothetical protein WR25_17203 [Diploscapter pachys]|uniref:Uncharacterized protein n=1 Tax=Diploscapter pachys TaxID=2018661 RepID=A0A2A2JVT9_9BILA|nr:hypothetical protein WR25_17203 [Diploscapter pachys]